MNKFAIIALPTLMLFLSNFAHSADVIFAAEITETNANSTSDALYRLFAVNLEKNAKLTMKEVSEDLRLEFVLKTSSGEYQYGNERQPVRALTEGEGLLLVASMKSYWPDDGDLQGAFEIVFDSGSRIEKTDNEDAQFVSDALKILNLGDDDQKAEKNRSFISSQLRNPEIRSHIIGQFRTILVENEVEKLEELRQLEATQESLRQSLELLDLRENHEEVYKLVDQELSKIEREIESTADEVKDIIDEREARKLALNELISLHEAGLELEHLAKERDSSDGNVLSNENELKQRFEDLLQSISRKLVESELGSPYLLDFGINLKSQPSYMPRVIPPTVSRELADAGAMMSLLAGSIGSISMAHASYGMVLGGPNTYVRNLVVEDKQQTESDASAWLPALLPWPPPKASTRTSLYRLVPDWKSRHQTLGDVDDTLSYAASEAGYSGPAYYGVPEGFALVTQLEQTREDGVPLEGNSRWVTNNIHIKEFSIYGYLKALFLAPPGYYRVLSFITTSKAFGTTDVGERIETIQKWSSGGLTGLPESVRNLPFTTQHDTIVLVYEFLKEKDDENVESLEQQRLTAQSHLRASEILTPLGG